MKERERERERMESFEVVDSEDGWRSDMRRSSSSSKSVASSTPQSQSRQLWNFIIWNGGSSSDAWLNAVTAQVGQVLLSLPHSYSQMGFKLGVFFHVIFLLMGCWASYLVACLYLEYRSRKEKEGVDFTNHVIQYHEVMGYLIGPWLKNVTLALNIASIGAMAIIQIVTCGSTAYYLNPNLDKRTWTLIFGGISTLAILLPTLHNFRIWSIVGVLTTTYTTWYMTFASLAHGQVHRAKHSAPLSLESFFTGLPNILYAFGGHAITMEIMHAMWKPKNYKYVYVFTCLYTLSITLPHSVATYWAFGDDLLTKPNAFVMFPPSLYKNIGLICMLAHMCVAFAIFVMPLFFLWEKAFGLHQSSYIIRMLVRLPVVILLWLLALLVPFFGLFNSVIGSLIHSFSAFIIPCLVYLSVFRTDLARQNAVEKPPNWIPGWSAFVIFSSFLTGLVSILGVGFGSWANLTNIINEIHTFVLFEKCYKCK